MPLFSPREVLVSDRVELTVDGESVAVDVLPGESLLHALRERLGVTSAKDGCAPQGQCGCCTVLVDGEPRVACVTPVARVAGRSVTTIDGLEAGVRDRLVDGLVATGGAQCGFCTPGIVVRLAAALARGRTDAAAIDRALAAHLCRCTGWQTIHEALAADGPSDRDLDLAAARAALEGGHPQAVGPAVPRGAAGFAADTAPPDALVAVPRPPGSDADAEEAAGVAWIVAPTLAEARAIAAPVQGRRTTLDDLPPLAPPEAAADGVALATGWVEPAYLEPDASWCTPGGEPASPLANAGAFGGKEDSPAPVAARELAARLDAPVRVLLTREDVVRLGPKRAPIAATARLDGTTVRIDGRCAAGGEGALASAAKCPLPYALDIDARWEPVTLAGPRVSPQLRAAGTAETALLVEGALEAAGADRLALVRDARAAAVLLATASAVDGGALAGARVTLDEAGRVDAVEVKVAAGDPLDDVVLRSYAIGATHMALGWVLTEGIAVDPDTGAVHDLTIRSFGIIRPAAMPPVTVTVVDEAGPPRPRASDAVFAAVAAAAWLAVGRAEGARPVRLPAREARAARALRR